MNNHAGKRIPVFLFVCVLAIGIFIIPFLAGARKLIKTTSYYEATWDGPFLTILLGKMAGYLPAQYSYDEIIWENRRGGEEFYMALNEVEGNAWLRLYSDKSQESAVWLPRKPKEILNNDVIRFVRTLREMFMDSSYHTMKGVFIFSKKKLFAEAREYALSQDEEIKFRPARAFAVLTFDTIGTPGIRGRVVVAMDSVLHYKKVSVFLPDDEIEVTLSEQKGK